MEMGPSYTTSGSGVIIIKLEGSGSPIGPPIGQRDSPWAQIDTSMEERDVTT